MALHCIDYLDIEASLSLSSWLKIGKEDLPKKTLSKVLGCTLPGDLEHCDPPVASLPLTFMWDLRLSLRAQRNGQSGHWWLFKPVWITMCRFQ